MIFNPGRISNFCNTCQALSVAALAAIMNGIDPGDMSCFGDNKIAGLAVPRAAVIERSK
jgi:hypothetical protein